MRILLSLLMALVPVGLSATTLVIFRTPTRVILATDSGAVGLDAGGRHHIRVDCKIRESERWWFVIGGFLRGDVDMRDVVATRIDKTTSIQAAVATLDDRSLRDRLRENKALYAGRDAGSPLMTVVIADTRMTVGVFMVSLKTAEPFEVSTEMGTCPGTLCPTGRYYLVGEPGDAPPNPLLKALPAWFQRGDAAAARQFINEQIAFTPQLARHPIDVLEITPTGARWVEPEDGSACAALSGPSGTSR
jgi:hypothetical protein